MREVLGIALEAVEADLSMQMHTCIHLTFIYTECDIELGRAGSKKSGHAGKHHAYRGLARSLSMHAVQEPALSAI